MHHSHKTQTEVVPKLRNFIHILSEESRQIVLQANADEPLSLLLAPRTLSTQSLLARTQSYAEKQQQQQQQLILLLPLLLTIDRQSDSVTKTQVVSI